MLTATLRETVAAAAADNPELVRSVHNGICLMNVSLSAWEGRPKIRGARVEVDGATIPEKIANPGHWSLLPPGAQERLAGLRAQKEEILDTFDPTRRARRCDDGAVLTGVHVIAAEDKADCVMMLSCLADEVCKFGEYLASERGHREIIDHVALTLADKKLLGEVLKLIPSREEIAARYKLRWRAFVVDVPRDEWLTADSVVVDQVVELLRGPRERLTGAVDAFLDVAVDGRTGKVRAKRRLVEATVKNLCGELRRPLRFDRLIDDDLKGAVGKALELLPDDPDEKVGEGKELETAARRAARELNKDENRELLENLVGRLRAVRAAALDESAMVSSFRRLGAERTALLPVGGAA